MKITIRKWFIFTEDGNGIPFILNSSKLNVSQDELALCVESQIYGK